jgi:hypothetical protein
MLAFLEHIEADRGKLGAHPQCPAGRYQCVLPLPGVPPAVVS